LPIALEEAFYSAIEDFKFPIMSGGAVLNVDLPKFTFVGATTRPDLISAPMRSRFTIKESLDFYTDEELLQVLKRTADIIDVKVSEEGLKEIAKRSRGTPRIANNLLKRVRDYGIMLKEEPMRADTVITVLADLRIDPMGLDSTDKKYLLALATTFTGGPVGVTTLAAAISEPEDVLIELIEPYLLRRGLIEITAQGRKIREQSM
jgi:Holliday junction DNA helicase RuvB